MLHNEERELLIRDYEAIHHAEGIAGFAFSIATIKNKAKS